MTFPHSTAPIIAEFQWIAARRSAEPAHRTFFVRFELGPRRKRPTHWLVLKSLMLSGSGLNAMMLVPIIFNGTRFNSKRSCQSKSLYQKNAENRRDHKNNDNQKQPF